MKTSLILLAALAFSPSFAFPEAAAPAFVPERAPVIGMGWQQECDSFSFAILGDKTSGGEGKWPIFDRAVNEINLLAPDFVITTGDQIPGHMEERAQWDAEWTEYLEHAGNLECPLVLIPGNHDIANTHCYEFWQEDFGATHFFFLYGNCLFLVLNTEEERFDGRGPVWEAMMAFAEAALREHGQVRHTFLFFHKPMWADPRFAGEWKRLTAALGDRRYTAIAGHEHYLSTSYQDGNPLIIMNATGAGVRESGVRAFGGFHAFAHVTVNRRGVQMAVMEPGGSLFPVDTAPASFREAINRRVVRLDAETPNGLNTPEVRINAAALMANPFEKPITVRLSVGPMHECGWALPGESSFHPEASGDIYSVEISLEPGREQRVPMPFIAPASAVSTPPAVRWAVRYDGQWLEKESMPMAEMNAAPLYPISAWRDVPKWQVAGPFPVGPIDTSRIKADPAAANPNLYKRLGPEDGYAPEARYEGGITWRPAASDGNGLLNHNAILGTMDLAAAYNAFFVYSPEDQTTHAAVYADNFAQAYLNGALVESGQNFGAPGGFIYAPLALKTGWNAVVVKVINNRGDWFLRWLMADPRGNLRFADAPPAP
ncbi:MAG: hypothetical protein BWX80_01419 [Candidatus Hydrogenedentes bacterium ADurb.Bin101]|nr:MAG: hypothetical protein BWX80_01419 [Candidatus Hydrogenedentes bacterium ADurb.Bin101]HOC67687.1 metallophosphoesterase [Candidatus Hydrogenedentota bacterium]HOH28255.1 metallophosphoesterase [Candidatus Hydrogenedentota bacterium]